MGIKKYKLLKCFLLVFIFTLISANPLFSNNFEFNQKTINLKLTLRTAAEGLLDTGDNTAVVAVTLIKNDGATNRTPLWFEDFDVFIRQGRLELLLGDKSPDNPLRADFFKSEPGFVKYFEIKIAGFENPVVFPIPAAPYALYSDVAERVDVVDASSIKGEFVNPVVIQNKLRIKNGEKDDVVLIVDTDKERIGIATDDLSQNFLVNVNGVVNAKAFKVDGKDIESVFSWDKDPVDNSLFYDNGNVIIGDDKASSASGRCATCKLDVAGTMNALEYRVNGRPLEEVFEGELVWGIKSRSDGNVNLHYGNETDVIPKQVAIGVENPKAMLDIAGAIRIGDHFGASVSPGTIKFNGTDFFGHTGDGFVSLTGIEGRGKKGELTFWENEKSIKGTDFVRWDDDKKRLGVGVTTKDDIEAALHIRARDDEQSLLNVKNSAGQTAFIIKKDENSKCPEQYCIGVGKDNPEFSLDVAGIVNADNIFINNKPLSTALSSGTFWNIGKDRDVFYEAGNVGIGTSEPRSTLELSSKKFDATLTYDLDGDDMYTMGVGQANKNAFIISEGSDLTRPVLAFNGNKIGVGTSKPEANFHVSGNLGFIVSGKFGNSVPVGVLNSGTKLLWITKKAAFRAGEVLSKGAVPHNWDEVNLGDHSVAMGYDPLASKRFSVVAGGYKNEATGEGAVVPGGFENKAKGAYSFAAGHKAIAKNRGTFVWADYTPRGTDNTVFTSQTVIGDLPDGTFESKTDNQFLIKAQNGVGIGTSETAGSVLTIQKQALETHYIKMLDENENTSFVLNSSGNIVIGTSDNPPGSAKLYLATGSVSIGNEIPEATLDIAPSVTGKGRKDLLFALRNKDTDIVSLMANALGEVGVGFPLSEVNCASPPCKVFDGVNVDPNGDIVNNGLFPFSVNGNIRAEKISIETTDPTTGQTNVTPILPGGASPWSETEKGDGIFYNAGFVGVGTKTPVSLLELSDDNALNIDPIITFDVSGSNQHSLGVTQNFFLISKGVGHSKDPAILIATENIGIGRGLQNPRATLDVSGNTFVEGTIQICNSASTDCPDQNNSTFALDVRGIVNVDQLFKNGKKVEKTKTPWITLTQGQVVIDSNKKDVPEFNGVLAPFSGVVSTQSVYIGSNVKKFVNLKNEIKNTSLFVDGAISVNTLIVSDDLSVEELDANTITFRDIKDVNNNTIPIKSGLVRVNNENFEYCFPKSELLKGNDVCKSLSTDLFKADTEDNFEGNLSFFQNVPGSTLTAASRLGLAEADLKVSKKAGEKLNFTISGNFIVENTLLKNGQEITSNVRFDGQRAFEIISSLNHTGNLDNINGYTGQKININVNQNWGNPNGAVEVVGLEIDINSKESKKFLNDARAIGLKVDVGDIDVAEGGEKYAAIFMGGAVGIGTSTPGKNTPPEDNVLLEVAGTVSTNRFNLTGDFNVPELSVANNTFVIQDNGAGLPRVGIGYPNPKALGSELSVKGLVSANNLIVNGGITTGTLNVGTISDPIMTVSSNGFIGFGTRNPDGQIVIERKIDNQINSDYISQKVDIEIKGAQQDSIYFFPENITGMHVKLSSKDNNKLESEVVGAKIDLKDIFAENKSEVIGLDIDVSRGNSDESLTTKRVAATFLGGFVGIGTRNPEFTLDVSGNIKATNLNLDGFLKTEEATFGNLVVNKQATINTLLVTNNIKVLGKITANNINLQNKLVAPEAFITTLNVQNQINVEKRIEANSVSANTLDVKLGVFKGVGIGTAAPVSGLNVSGDIRADVVRVNNLIELVDAEFNINRGALYVTSSNKNVGIGTKTPQRVLHVVNEAGGKFDLNQNQNWFTARFQNDTTVEDSSAGILFAPYQTINEKNIGSGIGAIREKNIENDLGAGLVFITDPQNDDPKERIRIDSKGNVGIGKSNPSHMLDVAGNAIINGSLIVNNTLTVPHITSRTDTMRITANADIFVTGEIIASSDINISKALTFTPTENVVASTTHGRLYVDKNDEDLYYLAPKSTEPKNISKAFTGKPSKIPFFNGNKTLSDEAPLYWDDNKNQFTIGDVDSFPTFVLTANYTSAVTSNNVLEKITMSFDNRAGVNTASTFKGMDILFQSNNSGADDFGRLGKDEKAIGLVVDMRELKSKQTTSSGAVLKGQKFAAAFLGGNVGVGIDEPSSTLHVKSERDDIDVLRVDVNQLDKALVVNKDGFLGLGSDPDSKFVLVAQNAKEDLFQVKDNNGDSIFILNENGNIGVGVAKPSVKLEIDGTISANRTTFGEVRGVTLNIGNGNLFVDADGNVGVGTTSPAGNFHFLKEISAANIADIPDSGFISEKLQIQLSEASADQRFYFNNNLTGVNVVLNQAAGGNTKFGHATKTGVVTATGVSINMSSFDMEKNARAIGLLVDVTKPANSQGTHIAAAFMGGNVGIGTAIPQEALTVSGSIKTVDLEMTGNLIAKDATFNSIVVSGDAEFKKDVTANSLTVNTANINNFVVKGDIDLEKATFATINVKTASILKKLGVNLSGESFRKDSAGTEYVLDVSGNMWITGNLVLTGNAGDSGSLTVKKIKALGNSISIEADELNVEGTVTTNKSVFIGQGLYFDPSTIDLSIEPKRGLIFVTQNNLVYRAPDKTSLANLTFTGTPDHIAFFNDKGVVASDAPLKWNNTSKTFQVGNDTSLGQLAVVASFNKTITGDLSLVSINMILGDRGEENNERSFTGLDINLESKDAGSDDFGRLGDGETATGLKVDVRNLKTRYKTATGTDVQATKNAAIFLGGFVGVGTSEPSAGLHVKQESDDNMVLKIDGKKDNAIVVAANGNLGFGTATPEVQMHIKQIDNKNDKILLISDDAGNEVFVVKDDEIVANHTISANILNATQINSNILNIGEGNFVVSANGFVGIGTDVPKNNESISIEKNLTIADKNDHIAQKIDIIIGEDTADTQKFFHRHDIQGVNIAMQSGTNHSLAGEAVGVSINLSTLQTAGAATVRGLFVDVGESRDNQTNDKKFAAIFKGGNVGVATENPTEALTVSGNLMANQLTIAGLLTASNATFNNLIVENVASFNGEVSVNSLIAGKVDVVTLNITDTLKTDKMTVSTLNVDEIAEIAELKVTEIASFNGTVTINGILTVNEIRAKDDQSITLNPGISVDVQGGVSVNGAISVEDGIVIKERTDDPTTTATSGALYIKDKHLKFIPVNNGDVINITEALTGAPGIIPYGNASGFKSDAPLKWDHDNSSLDFGTGINKSEKNVHLNIQNTLNDDYATNFTAQVVSLNIGKRTETNAAKVLKGIDIVFQKDGDVGRLAEDDHLIGLSVDVRKVDSEYSTLDSNNNGVAGVEKLGYKAAATFAGGSVGIGIEKPEDIRASLHVKSENKEIDPFRVDSETAENILVAAKNGFVGIGTGSPDASLTIKQLSAADELFNVVAKVSAEKIFSLDKDGNLAIGTCAQSQNDSKFCVEDDAEQDLLKIKGAEKGIKVDKDGNFIAGNISVTADATLTVQQQLPAQNIFKVELANVSDDGSKNTAFIVNNEGRVGIGIADPEFDLHVAGLVAVGEPIAPGRTVLNVPLFVQDAKINKEKLNGYLVNQSTTNILLGVHEGKGLLFSDHTFRLNTFSEDDNQVNTAITILGEEHGASTNFVLVGTSNVQQGLGKLTVYSDHDTQDLFHLHSQDNDIMRVTSQTVGINLGDYEPDQDYSLVVNGKTHFDNLNIENDFEVSTVNVLGSLKIKNTISNSFLNHAANPISITLNADIKTDLIGLDINMISEKHADYNDDNRKYVLYNNAEAVGLKVDMSDLRVGDSLLSKGPKVAGRKYSGIFKGGYVGITDGKDIKPEFPLHVRLDQPTPFSNQELDIARFSSESTDLTFRAGSETGVMSFVLQNSNNPEDEFIPLTLKSEAGASKLNQSRVGIGTTNPDSALQVNGDIRLGIKNKDAFDTRDYPTASESEGNKLIFSGALAGDDSNCDGDNCDPIYIQRFNRDKNQSELHVSIGDESTSSTEPDAFKVGYTENGAFKPSLIVQMDRKVGITDGTDPAFAPLATLHVKANKSGDGNAIADHAMIIENLGSESADGLAIIHSENTGANPLSEQSHFIDFFGGDELLGFIGANGGGKKAVTFTSQNADYAEYLEKRHKRENVEQGDIMGVSNGKISKSTKDAQLVMVKSSSATVAGNYPGSDKNLDDYALMAFFGQVPVKVKGVVNEGDFIIPSGKGNGIGRAISEEEAANYPPHLIVGRAWESSSKRGTKLIKVAVGFNFMLPSMKDKVASLSGLSQKIIDLKDKEKEMTTDFEKKLEDQNREIELLLQKVNALETK